MVSFRAPRVGLLLTLTWLPGVLPAQSPAALEVHVGPAEQGWPAIVRIGPLLQDPGLRGALESALPLRFHLRVELWRKGFLDRLEDAADLSVGLLQDPLGEGYSVETGTNHVFLRSLADAEAALIAELRPRLRPGRSGRYYYLATLEVETLSLSDLDELRRWLRGDVGPAIEGSAPASRAIERGLRRVMVRVIGLPTRRFEARTGSFIAS